MTQQTDVVVVAFHEAGHAIMIALEALPLDRVTIEPEGHALGHAAHGTFYMPEEEAIERAIAEKITCEWEQIRAEKNARVALAGGIAQQLHDPGRSFLSRANQTNTPSARCFRGSPQIRTSRPHTRHFFDCRRRASCAKSGAR